MSDPVIASIEGATGIIDLARPEKFNCLSLDVHERIAAARAEFEANPDIRAILIRAQGKHFCTGADLNEVKGKLNDPAALDHFIAFGMKNLRALETSSLPVVVAVQGLCLAGGIELMLACDVCFAGESAQFGDQHAQFGLIPGWGGSQRLTRLMGQRRALDLMFSARWLKSGEAKEADIGLTGGTPNNLIYQDGKPDQKVDNLELVDRLEKMIRDKVAAKQAAEANTIARG